MASPSLRYRGTHVAPRTPVTRLHLLLLTGLSLGCLAAGASLILGSATPDFNSPATSLACLVLLSATVLLPLSIRRKVASANARFTVEPIALLNALYFVVGPVLSLTFSWQTAPLTARPAVLLILSFGFFVFYLGIRSACRNPKAAVRHPQSRSTALTAMFAASLTLVWALRAVLLINGLGITHGPSQTEYARSLGTWAVVTWALAYVPLSLCLARVCRSPEHPPRVAQWSTVLLWVVASDSIYYLMLGWRLPLLWEFVILFWAWRSRPGCVSRRPLLASLLAVVIAIPLVYAQRAVLTETNLRAHENQVKFISGRVVPAEESLGIKGLLDATQQGFAGDAASRWNAVGWLSEVAHQHFDNGYRLLLGSSWKYGLAFVVPRALWPNKPVQENIDIIIDQHFGLFPKDELTTSETEVFANFGALGLWVWMFLYGVIAGGLASRLAGDRLVSESTLFLIFCAMPVLFLVETDTVSMLAGLRAPLIIWCLLMVFERRPKRTGLLRQLGNNSAENLT